MACENLTKYLSASDFECVADVARHCDLNKLCIATEEALQFDIIPLFCYDFVADILDKWGNADNILLCGGSYTDRHGKRQMVMGLKRVWVYYSYARYLLLNQFNDTANGTVKKQNDWSIPTPLKEVTDYSNKYRAMGKEAFESVHRYLCDNREDYPRFEDCNCPQDCGCTGKCSCGKTKKLTGFKIKSVKKDNYGFFGSKQYEVL